MSTDEPNELELLRLEVARRGRGQERAGDYLRRLLIVLPATMR
jgi:hypothetical protein